MVTTTCENSFNREVLKRNIPVCDILGVNIAAINMKWLIDFLKENVRDLSGDYLAVANVHTTVMAFENTEYRDIQNNAIMAIPDGGPLSTLGRKRGFHNMERTTGPDLMNEIFIISDGGKYSHYFFGSTEDTLSKLRQNLMLNYPGLNIVGMISPPFGEISDEDDQKFIKMINDANPDFIWVGLGAPKQEKWMSSHFGIVKGFMIGVGAGFDYLAGNIVRAPIWMQKSNLEWVCRFFQNPKKLFERYWQTNTKFIINVFFIRK